MTKLDHKGFSRSMEQFYSDVKLANHRSALAMEDILRVIKGYDREQA